MDYSTHRTYRFRTMVMAALMIIVGLTTIQYRWESADIENWRTLVRLASGFFLIIFGALMLVPRYRDIMPSVGLMCFGIGLSRLIVALSYTLKHDTTAGTFSVLDNIMWGLGYIILIFSLYQLYRGFNFMNKDSMNAFFMRFTSMGIVIAYVMLIIYAKEFFEVDYSTLWKIRCDFFTTPVLYTMYFILLCSKEVYDRMSWEQVRKEVYDVSSRHNPADITMTGPDYAEFRERYGDVSGWETCPEDCPVERRLSVTIHRDGPDMRLLLEKWRTSDTVYYSFVPVGNGYISAPRGKLARIEFGEEVMQVFGEEHLALRATVYDKPVNSKTLLQTLFGEDDEEDEIHRRHTE